MSSDGNPKPDATQKERASDSAANDYGETYDHVEEKRLVRKVDWRLLPILGALYSIALIDRTNVSMPVAKKLHDEVADQAVD